VRPATARRHALHAARHAGVALWLPLVVLGGCSQAPTTQGALAGAAVDGGDRALSSSPTQPSLPPDEDAICGRWPRVCD
jgi:hypothetical protein